MALALTYGLDAVCGLLRSTPTLLPMGFEIGLMGLFMVVMMALGLWVFKRLERKVRQKGTLEQH